MKDVQLIIFDLDGTLMDAYKPVESSINFTLNKLGVAPLDAYTIRRSVGWGDRNLLLRFVAEAKIELALKIYRRHHAGALQSGTKFLPGAKRLIADLKRKGYRLAIASNRPTRFTRIALKYLGVLKYFDYVLCADKLSQGKPHPAILLNILKKFNLRKDEALYVGDMTIDVETGNRAKVRTIAVVTGSSTPAEIKKLKPFKIIKGLSELKTILTN